MQLLGTVVAVPNISCGLWWWPPANTCSYSRLGDAQSCRQHNQEPSLGAGPECNILARHVQPERNQATCNSCPQQGAGQWRRSVGWDELDGHVAQHYQCNVEKVYPITKHCTLHRRHPAAAGAGAGTSINLSSIGGDTLVETAVVGSMMCIIVCAACGMAACSMVCAWCGHS
jgi:hypothetical protein